MSTPEPAVSAEAGVAPPAPDRPTKRAKKAAADKPAVRKRIQAISDEGDGVWLVQYNFTRYRVMFSDGSTFDVFAISDDSDVRGELLSHFGKERIAGITTIGNADG